MLADASDLRVLARPCEAATAAIARLDARISASFVARPWYLRACWSGYWRALRLQGAEIDEIDVFSWGCGVDIPDRQPRATVIDDFAPFEAWRQTMRGNRGQHWRQDLPYSFDPPEGWESLPRMLQLVMLVDRYARADESLACWLAVPGLVQRIGITTAPLPCLVAGDRAMRTGRRDWSAMARRMIGGLEGAAEAGLKSLRMLEAEVRRSATVVRRQRRAGALAPLAALLLRVPALTPTLVARRFGLGLSGAGKLLARAAEEELVVEVSGRRSWRVYAAPDIAASFGFVSPRRGRPPRLMGAAPDGGLDALLASFDAEMALIGEEFPWLGSDIADGDGDDASAV